MEELNVRTLQSSHAECRSLDILTIELRTIYTVINLGDSTTATLCTSAQIKGGKKSDNWNVNYNLFKKDDGRVKDSLGEGRSD